MKLKIPHVSHEFRQLSLQQEQRPKRFLPSFAAHPILCHKFLSFSLNVFCRIYQSQSGNLKAAIERVILVILYNVHAVASIVTQGC